MKKVILWLLAALVYVNVNAQKLSEAKVPEKVKKAFQASHPEVKGVKWEKEKASYEANFKQNNVSVSVLLDKEGNIVETETDMPVSQLPEAVKQYVAAKYKNAKIKEAARITYPDGKMRYEAEVNGKDLLFDESGKPVN